MKKMKISLISLIAVISLFSCGPNVEELGKQWDSNKAKVVKLEVDYPNLKEYLSEDLAKGSAIFENVASGKDEDEKLKLLKDANNKINNGIAGKISNIVSSKKAFEKSLTLLKAKAPTLHIDEANKDFTTALTQTYTSYNEASTALSLAKNNCTTVQNNLDNLVETVTKFEATKKDVPAVETKIDALLSDEEYTVRILKMVTDAKDALRDAKPVYQQGFTDFYSADQAITIQEITISEKLTPLEKIISEKEAANKPAETAPSTIDSKTTAPSANKKVESASITCKYCKTNNVASATKCSKCKAPLKK
tara:strand:- start:1591 stop:2511 length:921 start_codon:yes stop_codon:yes gene_type:complete